MERLESLQKIEDTNISYKDGLDNVLCGTNEGRRNYRRCGTQLFKRPFIFPLRPFY